MNKINPATANAVAGLMVGVSGFEPEVMQRICAALHAAICPHSLSASRKPLGDGIKWPRVRELKLKKRKPQKWFPFFGRSVGIRTRGLLDPNQARYQTSPHPVSETHYMKISRPCQVLPQKLSSKIENTVHNIIDERKSIWYN